MSSNQNSKQKMTFFNARLTSTISIALVLFILGLLTTIGLLASELTRYVKENIGLTVVVNDNISDQQNQRLARLLEKSDYVKASKFVSKEEAVKELTQELGENPEEFLGFNPLQAAYEIKLKAQYAHSDSLKKIERKLIRTAGVREVVYRKDMIDLVNDNIHKISLVLIGLAIIFMVIAFALISNTIRLTAYSKRFIIHTMRLVGATPGFIRKPFILSNIFSGIIGGVIAIVLLFGCLSYFSTEVENIQSIMSFESMVIVCSVVIILGIILTAISAYFAVNKYISMDHDDMYYI